MSDEIIKGIWEDRNKYQGLSFDEAKENLKKFGRNERPKKKKKTNIKRLWGIVTEPMIFLIFATAAVYFFVGEIVETFIFLAAIIPIVLMEFFQEKKTDETIEALDEMMVEKCKVYRDGKLVTLEVAEIVPGDLVYLTAGDKVVADGYLLKSPGLMVDVSLLTGESLAVTKDQVPEKMEKINEEKHKMFQGTLVVQGDGELLVESTGAYTAYGKLGNLLQSIEKQRTPLQKKIGKLIKVIATIAFSSSLLVGIALVLKFGFKEGLLGALAMAMSLIPEEFPVVFSVFLIMGVWRMAKNKALIREMAMVETLGSATVICTDKTGTLTEGRMSLKKIYYQGEILTLEQMASRTGDFDLLLKSSILALEEVAIDPIEIEMQKIAKKHGIDLEKFFSNHHLITEESFSSETKVVHHLWQDKSNGCFQYSAGAPENIISFCVLNTDERKKAIKAYEQLAAEGYRVIGVARKKSSIKDKIIFSDMELIGLIAMSDPPRAGVKEAIEVCQNAGIKIFMITGDNKLTAHNIAESIGLRHNNQIISGKELEKMSPEALEEAVKRFNIFCRVKPEHKFSIVEALQKNGEIVAMTGDGVNDAPALKKADIGISMGLKGTEVARVASGIVLMDDNFATIVKAVHEGRRIYQNLRQAFVFLMTFHLPIVGLAIIPVLFGSPLVFFPIHIIFLEFICDPASVLGFEREKALRTIMNEPPRPANEPLINPKLWANVIIKGLSILTVSLLFFYYFSRNAGDLDLGRTMAFGSLVISQAMLILFLREWEQIKSNKLLTGISLTTIVVILLIIATPFTNNLFHFRSLSLTQYSLLLVGPFLAMFMTKFLVAVVKK